MRIDSKSRWLARRWPGRPIKPRMIVLHTTEGTSIPSYSAGQVPHLTGKVNVRTKQIDWYQHLPFRRNARGLLNRRGGVETNHHGAIQIELCGTSGWANRRGGYGAFPDWAKAEGWMLEEVGKMVRWLSDQYKIPLVAPYKFDVWQYGRYRMSFSQWRRFRGICGHQHVPENDHTDPGAIDIQAILRYALSGKTGAAYTKATPITPSRLTVDGILGPQTIARLQQYLMVDTDGIIGPQTVSALQRHTGAAVDGIWGSQTTKHLQKWVGVRRSGVLSRWTIRALQKKLNVLPQTKAGPWR